MDPKIDVTIDNDGIGRAVLEAAAACRIALAGLNAAVNIPSQRESGHALQVVCRTVDLSLCEVDHALSLTELPGNRGDETTDTGHHRMLAPAGNAVARQGTAAGGTGDRILLRELGRIGSGAF